MNEFEKAIDNCSYSSDWYEYRCNMLRIVGEILENKACEWYHVYETDFRETKFHFIVFYIYDSLYVWSDVIINGLIEASQLDKAHNEYMASVLYANVEGTMPVAPILFKSLRENKIVKIC